MSDLCSICGHPKALHKPAVFGHHQVQCGYTDSEGGCACLGYAQSPIQRPDFLTDRDPGDETPEDQCDIQVIGGVAVICKLPNCSRCSELRADQKNSAKGLAPS